MKWDVSRWEYCSFWYTRHYGARWIPVDMCWYVLMLPVSMVFIILVVFILLLLATLNVCLLGIPLTLLQNVRGDYEWGHVCLCWPCLFAISIFLWVVLVIGFVFMILAALLNLLTLGLIGVCLQGWYHNLDALLLGL